MSSNPVLISKREFIDSLIQKFETSSNNDKLHDIITTSLIGIIVEDKTSYNSIDISVSINYLKNSLNTLLEFSRGKRKAYVKPSVVHRMGLESININVDSIINPSNGFTPANKYNRLYF